MSQRNQVVAAFNKIGISENDAISETELIRALDNLARMNGLTQYDRSVAEELWGETNKTNGDRVYIRDFIDTVIRGQNLVRSSIDEL